MKIETIMLRGLFIACITVCALIMGAMLKTTPASVQLAGSSKVASVLLAAPTSCALPADGVICPRIAS
ncbi:hypothetical protein [Rhodanobacter sp. L36]|uniref:hypothetical protein n=1 Tax=Rhodanobacter sp. L36 TaxID=1747221 RepID=UPI00131CD2A8|nr:hypothetical protein [Rhodanobacter sp. L36]